MVNLSGGYQSSMLVLLPLNWHISKSIRNALGLAALIIFGGFLGTKYLGIFTSCFYMLLDILSSTLPTRFGKSRYSLACKARL